MRLSFLPALVFLAATYCAASTPSTESSASSIEPGAKVFVEPMNGFGNDVTAALLKKHVPVSVVDQAKNADFLIDGSNEVEKASWAKTIFVSPASADHASITVKNSSTSQIVYAYSWDKYFSSREAQSAAEGIAKHLKQYIEKK